MSEEIANFFTELEHVCDSKSPFVVYRKPDENLVTVFVQRTQVLNELKSYKEAGFVFAPYNATEKKIFFPFQECDSFRLNIRDISLLDNDEIQAEIPIFDTVENPNVLKEHHIAIVQNAIDFIKNNKAKKIVLSRKETFTIDQLKVVDTFKNMLKAYKNAFVYLWYHPEIGLWMGATPERLLTVEKGKFTTMALAGTQKYNGTVDVVWQNKEIQEQQYVTDFMAKNLKESVESLDITAPFTVQAGNLVHIRTDISGKLKSADSLENLINILHPTPAVCGLPKDVAATFIMENEGYNRAY
ncbi:MAG: chorismate-binding protein, partial [Lutibacter sp.]|nr:chorismate-binding protein [Lutibacter sp.]